jgi:hypothetical protein
MPEQMIDLTQATPDRTRRADTDQARQGLASFAAQVQAAVAARRPASLAQAGNSVQVEPGGQTFTTISAALASITDASVSKQYVLYVSPGTYNETFTCKPWVFVQGTDPSNTIVTAAAPSDFGAKGTIKGASHAAIQNLTVQSQGSGWGCWAVAVDCQNVESFDIENCILVSLDNVGGANMIGLAVDYAGGASGSKLYVAYTQVLANCVAGQSQPLALLAFSGSFVQVTEGKLIAQGGSPGWGGASNGGSNLTVDNSYVQGAGFSLNIPDYNSTCVANQCQLVGPVQSGVVVNP